MYGICNLYYAALTHSKQTTPSYRNHSTDLFYRSSDRFLHDSDSGFKWMKNLF